MQVDAFLGGEVKACLLEYQDDLSGSAQLKL